MGRYWHCVLTADDLICIYSTVAIIRFQATTRTSLRLCSYGDLVVLSTAVLSSFSVCQCLYRGQTARVGAAGIAETLWTSVWKNEISRLDSREGQAI